VQREALTGASVHPDCVAAVEDAVQLLESLGHHLTDAHPDYDHEAAGAAFTLLIAANVQGAIDAHTEKTSRQADENTVDNVIRILAAIGHQKNAADMARAVWEMHRVGRAVAPFFSSYDVVLSPVVATPPPPLGTLDTSTSDIEGYLQAIFEFIPFTSLANLAGIPAMSVPLFWRNDGVPIGVHFSAGYGRDPLLFQLARQLEQARGWG
jgi:Asp-tRNA(Asn)/Glu-tRNA(Gln) amidotransferase A subunit family amidase